MLLLVLMVGMCGILRLLFVMPWRRGQTVGASGMKNQSSKSSTGSSNTASTLVVMGSGGHTTEMLGLVRVLGEQYTPRTYVAADTDKFSPGKIDILEEERGRKGGEWRLTTIPRSREVRQGVVGTLLGTLRALWSSVALVLTVWPDLILCNGPGTCVPICCAAYLPRILGVKRIKIVYVESICRVTSLSMSGKLLYWFADEMVVQWEPVHTRYPATTYLGRL